MAISIGSVVIPKKEFLDPGETQRPSIVVDIWKDTLGEKIALIDCEEMAKHQRNPNSFVPEFHTFSKYYDEISD